MKKTSIAFGITLAIGVLLLSLPGDINRYIQNRCRELLCSSPDASTEEVPESELRELTDWLDQKEQEKEHANTSAKACAPKNISYIVAKVIQRTQNSWQNFIWIDIGSDDNPESQAVIIAKNSPVLSRASVVGIVEYVGKKTSLVRLISDSNMSLAVRVARNMPDTEVTMACQILAKQAERQLPDEEQKAFSYLLSKLAPEPTSCEFLAKGVLVGHAEPMWRHSNPNLKGYGFTYDFKDAYGPARDLRTGEPVDPDIEFPDAKRSSLLQVGDLLITSGMDGLFPEGLKVATVQAVTPLQEGAYSYELEASATAHDLESLEYVTVLQAGKYASEKEPDHVDIIIKQME